MTTIADLYGCFFYGSLVNERTWLDPYQVANARLRNRSRSWSHCVDSTMGPVCALSANPAVGTVIDGIMIFCTAEQLKDFDKREEGYQRIPLDAADLSCAGDHPVSDVFIYASQQHNSLTGSREYPIWLSYLEAVLGGFLRRYPDGGIDRFISSTSGWSTPVMDDRLSPLYIRMNRRAEIQALVTEIERQTVQERLRTIEGVQFFHPLGRQERGLTA